MTSQWVGCVYNTKPHATRWKQTHRALTALLLHQQTVQTAECRNACLTTSVSLKPPAARHSGMVLRHAMRCHRSRPRCLSYSFFAPTKRSQTKRTSFRRISPKETQQPKMKLPKAARLLDPPKSSDDPFRDFVIPKQLDYCMEDDMFWIGHWVNKRR